jgi:23S rRNA A1618 N6-methylase RlmF
MYLLKKKSNLAMRLTLFLLLYFSIGCPGQTIKGIIFDSATKEAIPFASVAIVNSSQGASANLSGRFSLDVSAWPATISVRCVGYKTRDIVIQSHELAVEIELSAVSSELVEIVVRKGVNPAIAIIKKTSKNRIFNDPNHFESYSYQSYNKVFAVLDSSSSIYKREKKHSIVFVDQEVFVSESVVQHKYKKPDKKNEKIIAYKTSGAKNPLVAALLTDFQPFSFYEDWFVSNVTNKSYLNPLVPGSHTKYDFELLDTLINSGKDSTYIISFVPKLSVNIPLLTGFVHINTRGYAIENIVVASNDNDSDIMIQVQQQYQKLDGIGWFPGRCNTVISFKDSTNRLAGLKYIHKSVFSKVNINLSFSTLAFKQVNREIASSARILSDSILLANRADSLSDRERRTYNFYEENKDKLKGAEAFYTVIETALLGYVPMRKMDFPLRDFINYNKYEGVQLGIGFRTNNGLSKMIRIGGHIRYGIRDNAWKYCGELQFNFNKDPNKNLQLVYGLTVEEPATNNYLNQNRKKYYYREFLSERMDSIRRLDIKFNGYVNSLLSYQIRFTNEMRTPIYKYQLTSDDIPLFSSIFKNAEISGLIRYTMGGEKMNLGKGVFVTEPATTDGFIRIAKGIRSFNASYEYVKVDVGIESRFRTMLFGETSYQLAGGYVFGKTPYSYLYHGESAGGIRQWVYLKNSFQTMNLYEFVADRYFSCFLYQNFGQRFWRMQSKISAPELTVSQGIYFGDLSVNNSFLLPDHKVARNGYFESGIIVDKLLRLKYINLIYIDLGLGAFLRYGSYYQYGLNNNLSFRLLASASF